MLLREDEVEEVFILYIDEAAAASDSKAISICTRQRENKTGKLYGVGRRRDISQKNVSLSVRDHVVVS